ncbi:TauD/TfdA family dioxygenase [Kitasatospora sp. CB01950]|uniref:TauD/TfdA family dioxygenase n=1 Tax=Kitasatospora sp. CB01950 TaxID=1703930 RepID=UPI00093A4F63|nr:TauD/TfdA family dioxygenase [Kitasatospora sp. CB01950]OKI92981.1 SyrP [Kitasatospora sp. CB01950]
MSPTVDWTALDGEPVTTRITGLTTVSEARDWLTENLPQLLAALREHGAIYLRGLPVASVADFATVRDVLVPERTPYREKATPRSRLGDDVFSSTDLPPAQPIRMHNENSYTLTFPGLLLFGCLTAPAEGGATPVADCRRVLRALPADLVARMRAVGWQLSRTYSPLISTDWQTAFATEDPAEVERYCRENLIGHAWQPDGLLRTGQVRPGIVRHPSTGAEVWFNHLLFWNEWALDEELRETLIDEFGPDGLPFRTRFGDGTPLSDAELRTIQAAYDAATVRRSWEPGDVMLVDNVLTAHGRDPFHGERKVVVAMGAPVALADCQPTVEAAPVATALV